MEFFYAMTETAVSIWVLESNYGYYLMLIGHALGMATVVGVVLMLDLRVLGYGSALPFNVFDRLLTIGWLGFALNAATGILLFMAKADRYVINTPFILKILLIAAGGFSMWALGRLLRNNVSDVEIESSGRTFAMLSIVFWIGAIIAGRLIAYTLPPPPPPAFI